MSNKWNMQEGGLLGSCLENGRKNMKVFCYYEN